MDTAFNESINSLNEEAVNETEDYYSKSQEIHSTGELKSGGKVEV